MRDVGVFKTDNELSKFRQSEPLRHLTAQHADLAAAAFPRNHQHQPRIARIGITQKPQQRRMRLTLREAVQIESGVDRLLTARYALLHAAA